MKRIVAVGIALASLLGSYFASTATDNSYEACFRSGINGERTTRGIPALHRNAKMDMIASRHSDRMAEDETIYHNDNLADEVGSFKYAGENVAMGPDCDTIHAAFMASPGHRENILDRDYRDLGVGVTRRDDTIYVTEVFFTPASTTKPKARPISSPTPKCTCR